MTSSVQVLKPKTPFDRRLARFEQQRVWEHVGKTVQDDIEAMKWAAACAKEANDLANSVDEDGKLISLTMRLRCKSLALDFAKFVHLVGKETFQDRTIPVISRVDYDGALQNLPAPDDGTVVVDEMTDEQKRTREVLSHLRSAMDLMIERGVDRPGLIILDDEAMAS